VEESFCCRVGGTIPARPSTTRNVLGQCCPSSFHALLRCGSHTRGTCSHQCTSFPRSLGVFLVVGREAAFFGRVALTHLILLYHHTWSQGRSYDNKEMSEDLCIHAKYSQWIVPTDRAFEETPRNHSNIFWALLKSAFLRFGLGHCHLLLAVINVGLYILAHNLTIRTALDENEVANIFGPILLLIEVSSCVVTNNGAAQCHGTKTPAIAWSRMLPRFWTTCPGLGTAHT